MWFLDFYLLFSPDENQHLKDLEAVFQLLEQAGLRMKIEKCSFFDTRMELLGFEVTSRGVGPMQDKLNTIKHMVVSHDKKAIKSFLGLVRYYTRFVPNLAKLAVPLQNLLKKTSR